MSRKITTPVPSVNVPKFSNKVYAASRRTALCKLQIDKTPVARIAAAIDELLTQARDAGHEIEFVRGTLVAY